MEITARVLNTFDQRFTLDHLMLILDKARGKAKEWFRRTIVAGPDLCNHKATPF